MKSKAEIRAKIDEIKKDDRFQAPAALVGINAPLALIQVDMKAQVKTLEWVLAPKRVKEVSK